MSEYKNGVDLITTLEKDDIDRNNDWLRKAKRPRDIKDNEYQDSSKGRPHGTYFKSMLQMWQERTYCY
jgi:hypothetical protein